MLVFGGVFDNVSSLIFTVGVFVGIASGRASLSSNFFLFDKSLDLSSSSKTVVSS